MTTKYSLFLLLFVLFNTSTISAQTDDNIVWAAIKLQKELDDKTSMAFSPIFRFNEDISSYQNTSLELAAKRKFGKGFHGQFLARTWFLPDNILRQFLWFDIGYTKSINKIKVSSFVRMHYALTLKDRKDADFIRWKTTFTFLSKGKVKPWVAIEPWWRLNTVNDLQRMRYEAGINYAIAKQFSLLLGYRREASVNLDPELNVNMYLVTLTYKLD